MVVDPKAMKKSLHTDAVGQIEIITEYKHNKEGKLFWYKSFYKQVLLAFDITNRGARVQ